MKSKDAGYTVTDNDSLVRLRIFDGAIPPDKYYEEMLALEKGQHNQTRIELAELKIKLAELKTKVAALEDEKLKLDDELRVLYEQSE